ncbi:MAG: hypothetical protein IPK67_01880 [Planctomycetes bacterium]|jgi:transposase-like protein|nr:hypothetical protein [Planctomycetota bacterium]
MRTRIAMILTPFLLLAGFALAQKPADTVPSKAGDVEAKIAAFQKPSYPLDTCPISGEKLGGMGEPIDMVVDGQLVRLCCNGCRKGVEKDKTAVVQKIKDAVVAQQSVGYPMAECPISGETMDKPVNHVVGTRLVRFCCNDCVKTFTTDPAKQTEVMGKLDTAWITAQKAKYTVTKCPVSGEELDAKAVDHLYGTRLVRLCCNNCVKEFTKKPEPVLAKLAELQKAAPAPKEAPKAKGE